MAKNNEQGGRDDGGYRHETESFGASAYSLLDPFATLFVSSSLRCCDAMIPPIDHAVYTFCE